MYPIMIPISPNLTGCQYGRRISSGSLKFGWRDTEVTDQWCDGTSR